MNYRNITCECASMLAIVRLALCCFGGTVTVHSPQVHCNGRQAQHYTQMKWIMIICRTHITRILISHMCFGLRSDGGHMLMKVHFSRHFPPPPTTPTVSLFHFLIVHSHECFTVRKENTEIQCTVYYDACACMVTFYACIDIERINDDDWLRIFYFISSLFVVVVALWTTQNTIVFHFQTDTWISRFACAMHIVYSSAISKLLQLKCISFRWNIHRMDDLVSRFNAYWLSFSCFIVGKKYHTIGTAYSAKLRMINIFPSSIYRLLIEWYFFFSHIRAECTWIMGWKLLL